jgi:hypothetical protein
VKYLKIFFLQNEQAQIILRCTEFKILQIRGQILFKGEIIAKIEYGHLKIFFSRTTRQEKLKFT